MMNDRDVSLTQAMAMTLWTIGGAFVAVGYFLDLWFTGVGLWISGVGAVLSIRHMFCQQAARERNAFEIGREVGMERLRSLR